MSPSLPDILDGQAIALSTPQPPEAGDDYIAGRLGILGMLAMLAAQEAERGVAAAHWENDAIREIAGEPSSADANLGLTALTAENARLRRRLIAVHEAAEARGDRDLDRRILRLYREMARRRRLDLPPLP
ncbi:MAG: hypothetical protein ABI056_07140 [Caulobacteraceae bacterium]